jgi:hypothetical protein
MKFSKRDWDFTWDVTDIIILVKSKYASKFPKFQSKFSESEKNISQLMHDYYNNH